MKIIYFLVCVTSIYSCKSTRKLNQISPIELFNLRLNDNDLIYKSGHKGTSYFSFICKESNFLLTFGVNVKNYYDNSNRIFEYLRPPIESARYNHFDIIKYICSYDYQTSIRVKKHNVSIPNLDSIGSMFLDSIISPNTPIETIELECEDSLNFTYADYDYTIYRLTGKLDNGKCGTFFISNYFGVFKEYMPDEIENIQRDVMYDDQNFDIYMTHLYHLFYNPTFHVRCDNGPLFLFKSSYIKSENIRCNNNTWPTSGWGMK